MAKKQRGGPPPNDPHPVDMELRDLLKEAQRLVVEDAISLLRKARESDTYISAQDRQAILKMLKDNGVFLPPEVPEIKAPEHPDLPKFDEDEGTYGY